MDGVFPNGETAARRFYALELAHKRQHTGGKVERPDRDPSPGNGNDMSPTNDVHMGAGTYRSPAHNLEVVTRWERDRQTRRAKKHPFGRW